MDPLSELIKRVHQPGSVDWIGVRPTRRSQMRSVTMAQIDTDGVIGDRARRGKRAVTLMQAEHLGAIGSFLDQGPVAASAMRRNLVIKGINLSSLKGRHIAVGMAELRITGICAPCSRMEEAFGPGGYAAVRGHGGWCAEVLRPGIVRIGDRIVPVD